MKRGFTLLELIVVIIIIGILGTLGFTQYSKVIEKGRTAEAKAILGQMRTAEEGYKLQYGAYTATPADLALEAPAACVATHYYYYGIVSASGTDFSVQASRCTVGGKPPVGSAYNVNVNAAGTWGGTAGYY